MRRVDQAAVLDRHVAAAIGDGLAGHQATPDGQELVGRLVALVVVEPDAVAVQLARVAARHHVDQQPSARQAIQGRCHARGHGRLAEAGTHRHQEAQALRQRHHGRGHHPGILAGFSGRQQHPEIAELVGGAGDLAQIAQRDMAAPIPVPR